MSGQGASRVHSVHIYHRDSDLIARLCAITASSLRVGDSVLIVATDSHRKQLVAGLDSTGLDVRACVREGRYLMLDAKEALLTFMRKGMPDADAFRATMGSTLNAVRFRARSKNQGVTVFGEMVAVLWEAGKKQAALKLEDLWNAHLRDHVYHLHCAYSRSLFDDALEVAAVCDTHSHVLRDDVGDIHSGVNVA